MTRLLRTCFEFKQAILILLLATVPTGIFAQESATSLRGRLARFGDASDATATVTTHGTATDAVRMWDATSKPREIPGYRIHIFFDNSQTARAQAMAARTRFTELFPGIPSYIAYENPSWMVTVGNCVNMEEALILWNAVRGTFPNAFLWRGEIPVAELLRGSNVAAPVAEPAADSLGVAVP